MSVLGSKPKKMSIIQFLCTFLLLLPLSISLGRCSDISFSICWFSKNDALESQNINIFLNGTSLRSIGKAGKVTSLAVSPGVEHKLTLQNGATTLSWTFAFNRRTKHTKIRGLQKPKVHPTSDTKSFLQILGPSEVFSCENSTLYFEQKDDFFLAIGYTSRLPVKLDSHTSMLLLSWDHRPSGPYHSEGEGSHSFGLYHIELGSFTPLSLGSTSHSHHRFAALDSCSLYVACLELSGTNSFTCLSTITDPEVPIDFVVTSLNSSSVSLSWDCPENKRYSGFLLSVFGKNHTSPLALHWIWDEPFEWTVSGLPPCGVVEFGLQTVCQSGGERRYSKMIHNEGNSAQSNILNLEQFSFGPYHYSLSWAVGGFSSVSKFRLYHDGKYKASTLNSSFTVGGLHPCERHTATVQALCGEETVMDSKIIEVYTDPIGVSDLRFLPSESIAVWSPGTDNPDVSFLYDLSRDDGSEVQISRVSEPSLVLTDLDPDQTYILSVWEECGWRGQSSRATLEFRPKTTEITGRAAKPNMEQDSSDSVIGLTVVVPWSLSEDLQDENSVPWKQMAKILKNRMEALLADSDPPVRVELVSSEPSEDPDHTDFLFSTYNKNNINQDEPLWIEDRLDNIKSLQSANISTMDRVIYWTGPDLCRSKPCPQNSVCVNSLGSFSCVCKQGYYDVSSVIKKTSTTPSPVCNDKGLFSRCLDQQLIGGISKAYLKNKHHGQLQLILNDGRCSVNETKEFYKFKTSRNQTQCGTDKKVNESHIEYMNTVVVRAGGDQSRRRDLTVIWKCVYPRHYLRNAQIGVDLEWLSSASVVSYNSSLQLSLSMSLFHDSSFSAAFTDALMLGQDDILFFEVVLQTSQSFVQDVVLQIESCWATESTDPNDQVQGVIIQDNCPVDDTFHWLSQNGGSQRSRFSIQMFNLPQRLPLYFHCLASVCGPHENCTKNCTSNQRMKRSVSDTQGTRAAVVSVGPLVVTERRAPRTNPSHWREHMTMIVIVAGSIGVLFLTFLFVSATKAVMNYYEKLRLK